MQNNPPRGKVRSPHAAALLLLLLLLLPGPLHAQTLYWEDPRIEVSSGARFVSAVEGGGTLAVMWQEIIGDQGGGGRIYISARTTRDARTWNQSLRIAGPIRYEDRAVPIYSTAVDSAGTVYVAVAAGETEIRILRSADGGRSFETLATMASLATSLAPALFVTARGGLLLFVTQESGENLAIHYALSSDGRRWGAFQALVRDPGLPVNFRPYHAALAGRDYVVFQALAAGGREGGAAGSRGLLPYQLFSTTSSDGGTSWGAPVSLAFSERVDGQEWQSSLFSNQRPYLLAVGDRLALAWERQFQSNPVQIYYAELDAQGRYLLPPEAVTRTDASNYFPRFVSLQGRVPLFWFDNTDRVFVAERRDGFWRPEALRGITGASFFPYPVALAGQLFVFWENRVGGVSRLVMLQPDQSVNPPTLAAVNFVPGQPSRQNEVQVRWTLPRDSSGLRGASYVWSQDPNAPVPRELLAAPDTNRSPELPADRDGTWYFRAAVEDRAGNWSAPVTISFTRDTQPPAPPRLESPPVDEAGFLTSNTFEMRWSQRDPTEEVAGYAYALTYLGAEAEPDILSEPALPRRVETTATEAAYRNRDDGVWQFAVAALDGAGNISRPATAVLRLDKYVPVTYITYVNAQADPLGGVTLTIGGRGFTVGGTVREVILDRDGLPPYDYTFERASGAFTVATDRLIRNLAVTDIEEGAYRVGVRHPVRGLAWSPSRLSFESPGTVKYGDFSYTYGGRWESARRSLLSIASWRLVLWVVFAFLAVLFVGAVRKLASLAQESRVLRQDVLAVLRGEVPLERKEQRMAELKRRGIGLQLKFGLVIVVIVLIAVLGVSVALGVFMYDRQRANLTQGLQQRAEVLLGSIATGAENNLPIKNTIELGLLPDQVRSMSEAQFITVTGAGVDDPGRFDYVWASNDPNIGGKVTGGVFSPTLAGEVRIEDGVTPNLRQLADQINQEAKQSVSALGEDANRLATEIRDVALREGLDSPRVQELQNQLNEVNGQISIQLRELKTRTGSVPPYDTEKQILPFYTFYRPLVYRQGREDVYYRGAVRLGISTELIQADLRRSTMQLFIRTAITALAAAGLGLVGAIVMASITVNPIKKLAAGVAVIRDTEDKEQLRGHVIDVRSRDEIGTLAMTVNQMSDALVKAAIASKELTVGKEVQRMFIPLAKDEAGRKGTSGGEDSALVEIYGYYEGAKGVSGDYFDYVKLADKYYAMIKCDVAGKGVPAALIMVEVATIFSTYFRNWTPKSPGLRIDNLAGLINDMLEERGFQGRFAAFTLAILNAESGKAIFCNAGDTKLHMFKAAQRKMVGYDLPDTPAAGVFATMLVEMKTGFKQVSQQMDSGDILFLFTDGIEDGLGEVKRLMGGQVEGGGKGEKPAASEEFGIPRIYGVIDSVLNRRRFAITGHHNPLLPEEPRFDFSSCRGSVEEAVLALVSVEKVLRVLPDPSATATDRVQVDRRIDAFLRAHYEQYDRVFSRRIESEEPGETVTFSHLKEEEQYDDLTILVVRKK